MRAHHLSTLILLWALAACGEASPSPAGVPDDGDPQGSWQLVEGTVNGEPVPILAEHRITLTIEGSRIGGTAACNSYGGQLSVEAGRMRIADLGQTLMACVEEAAMRTEMIYMSGLSAAETIGLDGDKLVIHGPGVELRFIELSPPPTSELIDTVWLLEIIVTGDVAASVLGESATLELQSDGSISGSTGCRDFNGTWMEQGDEIVTPSLAAEDLTCPAPLRDIDGHVLSVVGDGFRATVDGNLLTLTDSGGLGLVYRASE